MAPFHLPIYLDLFATTMFALSGALAAVRRGYDVIGLFTLAFVSGVGGALLRDGFFIASGPSAVLSDPRYLYAIGAAGGMGLILRHRIARLDPLIAQVDALGLGAYAVVGSQKAMLFGLDGAAAILIGAINAVGGGLLRDIITREEPLFMKPGQFYAIASITGAATFVVLRRYDLVPTPEAALITVLLTYLIRAFAIRFNLTTEALGSPSP